MSTFCARISSPSSVGTLTLAEGYLQYVVEARREVRPREIYSLDVLHWLDVPTLLLATELVSQMGKRKDREAAGRWCHIAKFPLPLCPLIRFRAPNLAALFVRT